MAEREVMRARSRVAEFVLKWNAVRDKDDLIYAVSTDPEVGGSVELRASDLRLLVEATAVK